MSEVGSTTLSVGRGDNSNVNRFPARFAALDPLKTQPFRPSLLLTFRGHRSSVLAAGFQPSTFLLNAEQDNVTPPYVFSCGADGYVFLWSARPNVRALRFMGHRGPVHDAAWSPHANFIASAGHDGFLRLWPLSFRRGGGLTSPLKRSIDTDDCHLWRAHGGPVRAVAIAPQCDLIYTAGDDKSVKCWDINYADSTPLSKSGGSRFVCGFTGGHQNWIRALAVSGGGSGGGGDLFPTNFMLVASGGDDRAVRVWDTRSRRPTHSFFEHTAPVHSVDFHPDGCSLATGSADHTINLFDLRKNQLLQHYNAHDGAVNEVRFAPTGSWLLSASADGLAKLWDLKEGHLYCTLSGHRGAVHTARFSDDGAFFTTAGQGSIVMLWRSGLPRVTPSSPIYQGVYCDKVEDLETHMSRPQMPLAQTTKRTGVKEATSKASAKSRMPLKKLPKKLARLSATTSRSEETRNCVARNHNTEGNTLKDFCCSIDTLEATNFGGQSALLTGDGVRTMRKSEGSTPLSTTTSMPPAFSQKPPLVQPALRPATSGTLTCSSFSGDDCECSCFYDANGAKMNTQGVDRKCQEESSDCHFGRRNEAERPAGFSFGMELPQSFFFEDNRFLSANVEEDNKGREAKNGAKKGLDGGQWPIRTTSAFVDDVVVHSEADDDAVGLGDMYEEMSVVEYVGRTCDERDTEGCLDKLTFEPRGVGPNTVANENDEHLQHTENRLDILEKVCARLTTDMQVTQERNAEMLTRLQKQWETQQVNQRNDMNQLRQLMESLVTQQNELLQALSQRMSK